ncbi:MAG: ATP-dependent DNA ligase [Promethearchaeota archaeon]
MEFRELVEYYEKIFAITKRLEILSILSELFTKIKDEELGIVSIPKKKKQARSSSGLDRFMGKKANKPNPKGANKLSIDNRNANDENNNSNKNSNNNTSKKDTKTNGSKIDAPKIDAPKTDAPKTNTNLNKHKMSKEHKVGGIKADFKSFNWRKLGDLEKVIYLTQGRLFPEIYEQPKIGLADNTLMDYISKYYAVDIGYIKKKLRKSGDLGVVAEEIAKSQQKKGSQLMEYLNIKNEPLSISQIYEKLSEISEISGTKSVEKKFNKIKWLFARCSPVMVKYLIRIIKSTLRMGVSDATIMDALADAYLGDKKYRVDIERAYNLYPDLGKIARIVLEGGLDVLRDFKVQLGVPIRMMLASRLNYQQILPKLGGTSFSEYKLDGERLQVHKDGNTVRIFSRQLKSITDQYPDVAESVRKNILADKVIIEGEAVAMDPFYEEMRPFQVLITRKRKYNIKETLKQVPVCLFLFDILYLEGYNGNIDNIDFTDVFGSNPNEDLKPDTSDKTANSDTTENPEKIDNSDKSNKINPTSQILNDDFIEDIKGILTSDKPIMAMDLPFLKRRAILKAIINETKQIKQVYGKMIYHTTELVEFFKYARSINCEGLMNKSIDPEKSVYKAGNRGYLWIKLKSLEAGKLSDSLDVTPIGAIWGKGRRANRYGALIVAIYNPEQDRYEALTKVASGFSDDDIDEFMKLFANVVIDHCAENVVCSEKADVWFKPHYVIEIVGDELTISPKADAGKYYQGKVYESGYSLRFPVFQRLRDDKSVEEITTVDEIIKLYNLQMQSGEK